MGRRSSGVDTGLDRRKGPARGAIRHGADWGAAMMPDNHTGNGNGQAPDDDRDAWVKEDPTRCTQCGKYDCEDHLPPDGYIGFPDDELEDAADVAQQGRDIAKAGVP